MKGTPKGRVRRTASLVAMIVLALGVMAPAATFAQEPGGNCPGGIDKLDDDPRGAFDLGDGVELTVTDHTVTVTGGSVVLCVKGGTDNSGTVSLSDGESYTVDFTNPGGNTPAISNVVIYEVGGVEATDVCPNIDGDQAEVPEGMELVDGACVEIVVEPTDVCPNIDGDQAEVPDGMEMVGDACVEVDTGPDEVAGDDVTICHATASDTNPYELITVDVNAIIGGGHGDHADDIIPSFEYTVDGETHVFAGQNWAEGEAILAADCVVETGPDEVDVCPNLEGDQAEVPEGYEMVGDACVEVDTGPDEVTGDDVTICHATASDTNPYELITVDVDAIIGGGHGDHEDDIIPSFEYTVDGETHVFAGQNWAEGEAILAADCVVETGPDEVDVCPNIDGDQAEVPEGMELVDDACVEIVVEPTDVCPNIDGDQAEVPEGMELVDDECVDETVVGGEVDENDGQDVDGDVDDDGDVDVEEVVVVVPSDDDTEVLGVTQTRTAQLAATGPATLPLLVLFSLLSLLFGFGLRSYGKTARASK